MNDSSEETADLQLPAGAPLPDGPTVSLMARLAHEIPKPRDWQALQRNCVILYRSELNDPHVQEYGRPGQAQHGIDVLGRRNAHPDHWVGVKCRKISEPLGRQEILTDCRATLKLKADLKEIIFATTAPNDTRSTDAAIEVEEVLRAEGRDIRVAVLGWDNLSTLIATHPLAYAAFCPAAYSSPKPRAEVLGGDMPAKLLEEMQALRGQLATTAGAISVPSDSLPAPQGEVHEDKVLHAKIDTYRDLINRREPVLAEDGLKGLIGTFDPEIEGRADFRIKTNLGSIALEIGREADAIDYYEQAYAVRPNDPVAVASLALARTVGKRFSEAMELAREALAGSPPATQAVSYLLQAAARSDWSGDPESLVPVELAGTSDADLGLAEFWRIRGTAGWPERVIETSHRHADVPIFKRLGAQAVLALISENNRYLTGGKSPISREDVSAAADELKAAAEYFLKIGLVGGDAAAWATNAAVILRYCGRSAEAETLLTRAVEAGVKDSIVIRMLGLVQSVQGKRDIALKTLRALPRDDEAMLLVAELIAERNPQEALKHVMELPEDILGPTPRKLRWQIAAELAIRIGDESAFENALERLRGAGGLDTTVKLLRIRNLQRQGAPEAELAKRARAVAEAIPDDVDMPTRVLFAGELRDFDRPLEASRLLEGHVDMQRISPASLLYLQVLAGARRDDAFRTAFQSASREVREYPEVLWLSAAHGWNVGDLDGSLRAVTALVAKLPDNFQARLLKIEILARLNRSSELSDELEKPVEDLENADIEAQLRIVSLLGHFGFRDRAAAFAYRLFSMHRDDSRVWMALSSLVLAEGQERGPRLFDVTVAAPNAAVDITFEDGEQQFFVIEPDPNLRSLDHDSREPDHPFALAVMGKSTSEEFEVDGRKGTINQLRHKCVARFHYILQHYEERFPAIYGFRGVKIDPSKPDGLDAIKAQLAEREAWVREQSLVYEAGNMPLAVLAQNTGTNVIDVAGGIGAYGIKLKVAISNEAERKLAAQTIAAHSARGCVMDLFTYWTAHRLGALDTITAICGPISVTQHTLDELRIYRARNAQSLETGLKTMSMSNGQIQLSEATPQYVAERVADIDRAILWVEDRGANKAIVASDRLPDVLLEHLQSDRSHLFDEAILALHSDLVLLSDDLLLRQVGQSLGLKPGVWLHWIAGRALQRGLITLEAYITWSAALIEMGQTYLGISSTALIGALEKDVATGQKSPGPEFLALAQVIGGEMADPRSHAVAVLGCIKRIWADRQFSGIKQLATSHLLRRLLLGRYKDYRAILRSVVANVRDNFHLTSYIFGWAKGHFVADAFR